MATDRLGRCAGAALSVYGLIFQRNFIAASVLQASAHVAGALAFDPLQLPLVAGFLICAALLLRTLPHPRQPVADGIVTLGYRRWLSPRDRRIAELPGQRPLGGRTDVPPWAVAMRSRW